MQRIEYTNIHAEAWDTFVLKESRNGTIFHERNFLSYHPSDKFIDKSLLFTEGDQITGVFPAVLQEGNILCSHPGSSAGGLIFTQKAGLREVLEMLDSIIEYATQNNYSSIDIRLAENIFAWPVCDEINFALWHRGFHLKAREISSCIPLQGEYIWQDWGRKKNIFDIRKCIKEGYTVQNVSDTGLSWDIINANLNTKYQKTPTHSREELIEIKNKYPDRVDAWICYGPDGNSVGTVVCFRASAFAIHDFYIAQDYQKVKLNLLPFVFHEILTFYKNEGYLWFNFGISSRGDLIKWGILEFKERIGGRAINRDRWVLDTPEKTWAEISTPESKRDE